MSVPLTKALAPILHILQDPKTEDLAIQEPGVAWWLHSGSWNRVEIPAMTVTRMHAIAVMAAAQTRQEITHRAPIIDADLLGNLRLLAVMPPAIPPGTMVLVFRRGDQKLDEVSDVSKLFGTSRWNKWDGRKSIEKARDGALLERYDAGDLSGFLQGVADTRQTGLFAGPTGAGKTRMSKMLGSAIGLDKRIITVEDAAEMVIRQPNYVRFLYASSGVGVTQGKLLKATLRARPSIMMISELRDSEAASVFLNEIMAGHPGAVTTLHGRNAPEAAKRLFDLIKEGRPNTQDETIANQIASAVDYIIPVENEGSREIAEVWFRAHAARRGETFRDLLRDS